jgi:dTDP-glucose 4,6-dehydratase
MIKFVEDRKAHDRRYAIDPTKIGKDLAWKPGVRFEEGIKMTFEWYENNTDWVSATESRIANFIVDKIK